MKLAKSSPHYYLVSSTYFSWMGFAVWSLYALGVKKLREMAREGMRRDNLGDGWCVLYLVLGIVSLEGAFVQFCWTGAQVYAYYALFRGGKPEHDFLETFMQEYNWRVMAQLGSVVEWLVHGVYPEGRDVVTRKRWLAGAGYVGVVSGTLYMVRYSNKYFVLLEMLNVWVMAGWMTVALVGVGMERLRRREINSRKQQ